MLPLFEPRLPLATASRPACSRSMRLRRSLRSWPLKASRTAWERCGLIQLREKEDDERPKSVRQPMLPGRCRGADLRLPLAPSALAVLRRQRPGVARGTQHPQEGAGEFRAELRGVMRDLQELAEVEAN